MSDPKKYAVNPSTGEVVEFNGQAWTPVEKQRVAKNPAGEISVFNGTDWQSLGAATAAPQSKGPIRNKYTEAVEANRGVYGDEMARQVALGTRYMLEGANIPAAIVGNAANGVANLGISGVNAVAGTNIPKFQSYEQYRDRALENAGLPQPQNAKERVIGDMSRFVAGVGPAAGMAKVGEMMGTKAFAPMAENLGAQAIAAEVGGGAYGISKEHTDNPWIQALSALGGSLAGGAGYAAAENFLPSNITKMVAPSTQQIKESSAAAYKVADDLSNSDVGAILRPDPIKQIAGQWQQYLADKTYKPALQPNIKVLIDELDTASQGNITVKGLDGIRQVALDVIGKGDPKESMLAGNLINRIDDLMANIKADDIVQGDAQGVADALRKGAQLWKTFRKSELIDDAIYAADLKNSAANSGGNLHNKLKQAFSSILLNENKIKNFTAEERAAMEKIVKGTWTQDTLRIIGRMAPSSNSSLGPLLYQIGGAGGGGYMLGGPTGAVLGAAVPISGSVAKAGANALTNRSVNNLSNMVRSAAIPKQAPIVPESVDPVALAVQALMQGTRPLPPNAYAEFLLRSGGAAVPASDSPNTGPRRLP